MADNLTETTGGQHMNSIAPWRIQQIKGLVGRSGGVQCEAMPEAACS